MCVIKLYKRRLS